MQKILIVDDTPAMIKTLADALKNPDYKIFAATNGANALKIVADEIPELILLDIMMPEMDGYEVCKKLKTNDATRSIPVIFITALDYEENETFGLELGAVDYITKPIKSSIVQARVKTHLKLKRAYEELEKKNIALKESALLRENVERILHHDLKSPLNAVIGYSELLQNKPHKQLSKRIKWAMNIMEAGYQMLDMINHSLDIYKMETGTYQYSPSSVNILSLLNKIVADTKNLLTSKNLLVDLLIQDKPVIIGDIFTVQGEQLLCYSLFANLVKNAIEASPEAEHITISLDKKEIAMISIHNQGAVPKEIRDKFFDKYVTAEKNEGTGLGTYSAKLMAETQGGSIHFETSEEMGTTVTVFLQK
jgi:two-component system sensor histidine kinase/response regulator